MRVCGYPRYAIRVAAEKTVRAIVRSVDPRLEARFKARHELLVALGFLKGTGWRTCAADPREGFSLKPK